MDEYYRLYLEYCVAGLNGENKPWERHEIPVT